MKNFTVIDGDGPQNDAERDRCWVAREFSGEIKEVAANLLRIIRGAGKPHELMRQMQRVLNTSERYQQLHGYWPSNEISKALGLQSESYDIEERANAGEIDKASIERWRADGTFERMFAEHGILSGALQTIASRLVGQRTQKIAGESELHAGVREMIQIRDERKMRVLEELKKSKPARRPRKNKLKRTPTAPR